VLEKDEFQKKKTESGLRKELEFLEEKRKVLGYHKTRVRRSVGAKISR